MALKVFKELAAAVVAQVESADVAYSLPDAVSDTYDYEGCTEVGLGGFKGY